MSVTGSVGSSYPEVWKLMGSIDGVDVIWYVQCEDGWDQLQQSDSQMVCMWRNENES